MKKILSIIIPICLLVLLVGCKKTTTTTKPTGPQKQDLNEYWDNDQNGIYDFDEAGEIKLTYSTWQTHEDTIEQTIDYFMINEFMKRHPNVKVEIKYVSEDYDWDATMTQLAEVGDMPDVFLIRRLETFLQYNMLADISEQYNNDPDTEYIFQSLQNSGVYNGGRYAIPSFVYAEWWFVNNDILKTNGIEKPSYNWTWEQMESISSAVYNETTHTVGFSGYIPYWKVLPKVLSKNPDWASYGFDTKSNSFKFDDPAFESAITMLTEALSTNACTHPYNAETIAEYYGETVSESSLLSGYNIGFAGHSAIWTSPSWYAKDHFKNMSFDFDVYPAPGGTIGGNTDIIGLSSTLAGQKKMAAYQLAKWLSYSEEGLIRRFDLYDEFGDVLYVSSDNYPYPVADYLTNAKGENLIWDNLPYTKCPGMTSPQMISALKNGAFVLNKEVPGWDDVDEAVNPYLYEIANGENTFAAVKETIISESARVYAEFNDNLKARIDEFKNQ